MAQPARFSAECEAEAGASGPAKAPERPPAAPMGAPIRAPQVRTDAATTGPTPPAEGACWSGPELFRSRIALLPAALRLRGQELQERAGGAWRAWLDLSRMEACMAHKEEVIVMLHPQPGHGQHGARRRVRLYARTAKDADTWRRQMLLHQAGPARALTNVDATYGSDAFSTGDVVVFRLQQVAAGLQRVVTGSDWDHTALVVPLSWGASYLFGGPGERWALLEATPEGVIACPLAARLEQYREDGARICVRHLRKPAGSADTASLRHLFTCSMGQPYSYRKMLSAAGRAPGFRYDREVEERTSYDGYFCSELCALALFCLGALDCKRASHPTAYWPRAFMQDGDIDRHLSLGFSLSCEVEVDVSPCS